MDDIIDADAVEERGIEELDRYHAISYMDGDDRVTVIQDFENDDAWIQSDLAIEART